MKPVHLDIRGAWDSVMGYRSLACGRFALKSSSMVHTQDYKLVTCKQCKKSQQYRYWLKHEHDG